MNQTLSFQNKFTYGLGQFAWSAKDICFHYFLFFFYTQILGLDPGMAGLASLLALVVDGITDPIIGQVSDNYRGKKWGRRHPFMIVGAIPFCLSLVAIFNPPADLGQTGLFFWYLSMALVVRISLTLFSVPHLALGAELSEDYAERTSIAVFRNIIGYLGGLGMQVAAWFVFIPMATANGDVGEGYRWVGLLGSMLAFVGMTASILGTRKRIPLLTQTSEVQRNRAWYHAFADIAQLLRYPSSRILISASLVVAIAVGVSNTLLLHINNFLYGFSSEQTGVLMLCIILSLIPASWMALRGTHRIGKPKAAVGMLSMVALIGPVPVLAHLYGFAPPTGSNALLAFVCLCIAINQSFYIAYLNTVAAMLPDVADEVELHSGMRQEGILNSALMLTQKLTFGVGAFVAGITLEFAGFEGVTELENVTHAMQAKLAWVYGPGITLIVLCGIAIFSRYRLSEARYMEIREQLVRLRAKLATS
jgi:glycoside/pentoside/hexuronide:cation symporter, GPH family